jgi:hypothetical protein
MESQVEFEAHRVAFAFDVNEWRGAPYLNLYACKGWRSNSRFVWDIHNNGYLYGLAFPDGDFWLNPDGSYGLYFKPDSKNRESMARGLFLLGFQKERIDVANQLPPLSTHEQLELRLSLPREFWPQTWLDELQN